MNGNNPNVRYQWMDKQNVVYLYKRMSFGHKNEILIHGTRMNFENIMLYKKPVTKDHMLYDSIYKKCLEKANL